MMFHITHDTAEWQNGPTVYVISCDSDDYEVCNVEVVRSSGYMWT